MNLQLLRLTHMHDVTGQNDQDLLTSPTPSPRPPPVQ